MLRIAAGLILLLAGTVWILQGFDVAFAPESFMTGDRVWIGAGAAAVVTVDDPLRRAVDARAGSRSRTTWSGKITYGARMLFQSAMSR